MFISPTEPKTLQALGVVSSIPEEYGADILWSSKLGLVGIQRKVFPGDFLASVRDGRFYEGLIKMKALDMGVLVIEGEGNWTTHGQLITNYGQVRWDRESHRNFITSVQMRGIVVLGTPTLFDTLDCVAGLQVWSNKDNHTSLDIRPSPDRVWGTITSRDYQLHILKSLPGVNVKRAGAILDTIGFPFALTATEEDLMRVPGIGRKLAEKIAGVFQDVKEGVDGS